MELKFRNAKWDNPEHTSFTCELDHPIYGWIPFTASPNDPEVYGREIFNAGITGVILVEES